MTRNHRPTHARLAALAVLAILIPAARGEGQEPSPSRTDYLEFIRSQAAALRADDRPPASLDDWRARRETIRRGLLEAWGGFPAEPCPLEPRVLGTLDRAGYRVEKVVFQTRPGVWMTANAYVPDRPGKVPAILMVHGHWRGAKQDPVVQARCIGAAKLGFFVLVVDAFGAGERGVGEALGEYHGEMIAATLLPVGLPLSGLQVYENLRAVDYLRTRPEVDPDRIGITGASGGGNQSMYAGAWDERLGAVVPVCSVGNYKVYLGAACCMCEVVPGALRFTEEWGVLGLAAPRALMVVNATRDAPQFSVAEAKVSLAAVEPVFRLHGHPEHLRHAVFESKHDYSRPMREAMYGWMALHLKGEGDGSPIAEPESPTEDPETLRCYPGDSRPDDWVTIPRFAAAEGRRLLAARTPPTDAGGWRAEAEARRKALVERVFGGFPEVPKAPRGFVEIVDGVSKTLMFDAEPGSSLNAAVGVPISGGRVVEGPRGEPLAVVVDLSEGPRPGDAEGKAPDAAAALVAEARRAGWRPLRFHPRATGLAARPNDKVGAAPDHNTAEWALWIGRPLLGQWAFDVRRLLDALETSERGLPADVAVIGVGPGGVVALAAAAVDPRITRVAAVGSLASYITEQPYVGQRLGVMAPGILREVGDVADLAALVAPRRVVIAGGVAGNGQAQSAQALGEAYARPLGVWLLLEAEGGLSLLGSTEPAEVIGALR